MSDDEDVFFIIQSQHYFRFITMDASGGAAC